MAFYWKRDGEAFSENRKLTAEITADGTWNVVSIDLTQHEEWSGLIRQVRIDPVQSASLAKWIGIDYITLDGVEMDVTIGPKPLDSGTLRDDYASQVSDCENWPKTHARSDIFKTNLGALDQLGPSLIDVVTLVESTGMAVDIEVGGLRPWDPAPGYDWTKLAEDTFYNNLHNEFSTLDLWTQTEWSPGHFGSIESISTDHAIMHLWARATSPPPGLDLDERLDLLLTELMEYFGFVHDEFGSGVKLGVIESLGFFNFPGYPNTVGGDPDLDFEDFIAALVAKAAEPEHQIPLDHFDIDFSFGRYGAGIADTGETDALVDYGRILAAEEIARSYGLDVGLIFIDCGANDCGEATNTTARRRTVRFFAEYMGLGHPDRAIIQTWFDHPEDTGPETAADTFFAMAGEIATILPPSVAYEFSRGKAGWTFSGLTQMQDPVGGAWDTNGLWLFTAQSDPQLIGPQVGLDASLYDRVDVRMANSAGGSGNYEAEIRWKREGETTFPTAPYLVVPIGNEGSWEEVSFDLSSASQWSGTITQLRVDPVQTGVNQWVGVDFIRVIASEVGTCP